MRKMTNDVWVLSRCERHEGCDIIAIFDDYQTAVGFAEDVLGYLPVRVEGELEWIEEEDLRWFETSGNTVDFYIIEGHDVIGKSD